MASGLADLLSGAAGAPVNRSGLNAFVANSQAQNGLRSAQTDEALLNAQRAQDEQVASGQLEDAFIKAGSRPADAHLMATAAKMHAGSAVNAMDMFKAYNSSVLGDPSKLNTPDQTAAAQAISGKLEGPQSLPANFSLPPGVTPPQEGQSIEGVAQTKNMNAEAALHQAQANAGGFNPNSGGKGALAGLDQDHITALNAAVTSGRLDPTRLNSRTAPIWAELEMRNPGATNFNRLTADAALQRNATFQQKAMGFEALPTVLSHMTTLGKKLGYSDIRTVGKMQAFLNGETNDPDYSEYMSVRNDALMNIASLMRGVGMSDQAHRAEMEAAAPTLSPLAIDAWFKGQMSSLEPRLKQVQRVEHLGDQPNSPVGLPPVPGQDGAAALPPGLKIVN